MTNDTLAPWERWPVAALLAAAGLNTAVWYVGATLTGALPLPAQVMLTIGGVAAVVAIDGAMIATVAGMREGRRSWWGFGNIAVTALFTALAALSAHGVWPGIGGALHALFALTIVSYLMHLSQPRQDALAELASREQAVARQAAELGKARQEAEQILAERAAELASREAALAGRTEIVTTEYIKVASAELSWADLHRLVDMARRRDGVSMTTLRRLVTKQEGE